MALNRYKTPGSSGIIRDPRETKEVLKGKMLMCDLDAHKAWLVLCGVSKLPH